MILRVLSTESAQLAGSLSSEGGGGLPDRDDDDLLLLPHLSASLFLCATCLDCLATTEEGEEEVAATEEATVAARTMLRAVDGLRQEREESFLFGWYGTGWWRKASSPRS